MSGRVVEPRTGVYRLSTRLGVDRLGALPMEAFRTLRPTAFIVNRQTFVSASSSTPVSILILWPGAFRIDCPSSTLVTQFYSLFVHLTQSTWSLVWDLLLSCYSAAKSQEAVTLPVSTPNRPSCTATLRTGQLPLLPSTNVDTATCLPVRWSRQQRSAGTARA